MSVITKGIVQFGRLGIDYQNRMMFVDAKLCPLTEKEYEIMEYLFLNRDKASVTREELVFYLFTGWEDYPEANIIDIFISKIRKKLRKCNEAHLYIQSIRGKYLQDNYKLCRKNGEEAYDCLLA